MNLQRKRPILAGHALEGDTIRCGPSLRFVLLLIAIAFIACRTAAAATQKDQDAIRALYHLHDELTNAIVFRDGRFEADLSGFHGDDHARLTNADFLAPTFTLTFPNNTTRAPAAGFQNIYTVELTQNWTPSAKTVRAERWTNETTIERVDVSAGSATVTGTRRMLFQTLDRNDTFVAMRALETFEDSLASTSRGWRIDHERVLTATKPELVSARPSPVLLSKLKYMHDANSMIRAFDKNVNYSYCYNSDAMTDQSEAARVEHCSH